MTTSGDTGIAHTASAVTRWGILSAGKISNDFCLALRTLPETEHKIVAVAARKKEDADAFATKHKITTAYASYDSLASDPNIDVVYIGTIHTYHAEWSKKMLKAGKHVVCEKPMGMSSAEVASVLEVAAKSNKLFVEGLWSRFFPAYEQLRKELQSKKSIGEVKVLNVCFGFKLDIEKNPRLSDMKLGGGATLDIGCYAIQLANLVFENERPEKIIVNGSLYPTGADKTFSATLLYKNGRMAQMLISLEVEFSRTAHVYGENGFIEIPMFWCPIQLKTPTSVFQYGLPDTAEPTHFTSSAGFVYEIQAVREAILKGLTEMREMTHADSILSAEIMDEFLKQLGVAYS